MNRDSDNSLLETSQQALNDSIDKLDAQTLSRLNQARQKALSKNERTLFANIPWLPAGSLAMLSIAVVVGSLLLSSPDISFNNLDEAEFMASNEDIELMEDLEFIAWLIEEENAS